MNNKKPLWITLAVFCGVLLLIGFKLTKDKVDQYSKEIAARKA